MILTRRAALLVCLLAAACAAPRAHLNVDEVTSRDASAAAEAVSQFRKANGLGPVSVDARFNQAAQRQAEAMAASATLSHTIAGDFSSRMKGMGFNWGYSAENLGMGYADVAGAMRSWRKSPGHRENLLMPQVTRIGFAMASAGGRKYWALILASPDMTPTGQPRLF
jgi:uncharacterized protein YkwD